MLYCAAGQIVRQSGISIVNMAEATEAILSADIDFDISDPFSTLLSINGKDVTDELFSQENKSLASVFGAQTPIVGRVNGILKNIVSSRDTVVDRGSATFLDPDLRFWLTASPKVRAERRQKQLIKEGRSYKSISEIVADNTKREIRDLVEQGYGPTVDSVIIDTTNLSIDSVFMQASYHVEKAIA